MKIALAISDFEAGIVRYFNGFADHSAFFDRTVFLIADDHLLKSGLLVAMIWWIWFKEDPKLNNKREHLVITLIACLFAVVVSVSLTYALPFRPRPLYNGSLHLIVPDGLGKTILEKWSSFPSDHASLYFALTTGFFFISKKIGLFSLAYSILFICLPRIYLGLHYPSDIIGGAVIGASIAFIANKALASNRLSEGIMKFTQSNPELFYPAFFLVTYQIADLFQSSRELVSYVFK
jgi:undecaprenyl-diphosphatase